MKPISAQPNPMVALLALLASGVSASAGVLVVDEAGGPGADFTEIQAAVNAAVDGDTILVRNGLYYQFWISGKSLSLVADGGGALVSAGTINIGEAGIWISGLARDQRVLVRGLRVECGVAVYQCEGPVWFDDVVVSGDVPCGAGGVAGGSAWNSSRVTFTRCSLRGVSHSDTWLDPHPSAHGLDVSYSTVHLFDCVIQGGWGQDASAVNPSVPPLVGGAGLRVEASTVTIAGCAIQGGEGGVRPFALCAGVHAAGGPGVLFIGSSGVVRSAQSTAVGGIQSLEPFCPGQTGPQGPAISGTGTIVALTGFARHLRANSPVRGGETLTFELEGQPGELPLLFVSGEHEPVPMLNGTLLVGLPPSNVFVLAPLPATGQGSLAFPVPNVGTAMASLTFYAQAVFLDPSSAVWLGAGTSVVLLDASF